MKIVEQEVTLKDILMEIKFVRDNMVTKEEAKNFVVKEDLIPIMEKLEEHSRQIGRLEKRMDSLENRMDSLEKRMDNLENRMDNLEKRVDSLEIRMDDLENSVNCLEKRVYSLENNVVKLEKEVQKTNKVVAEIKFGVNGLAEDIAMLDERTRMLVIYKNKKQPIL